MKDKQVNQSESPAIPVLSVNNIHKQFGYKSVLNGVSLDLYSGQTTLLVGKNGAGKSTLVKILAGLMRPSKGDVHFTGKPLADFPEDYRKAFGLITHQTLFYDDLTAKENLFFFGKLRKVEKLKEKITHVLQRTGLEKSMDVQVKAFSSGMGKRLNIARLMISDPKILFLDEPYSGLDLDSIDLLNDYLAGFKDKGGTVLLISHQVEACYRECDSVAMLVNGKITRVLSTDEMDQAELQRQFRKEGWDDSKLQ